MHFNDISDQPDRDLLDRYLAGQCTDLERESLKIWLRNHPEHAIRLGIVAYVAEYPRAGMRAGSATTPRDAFDAFMTRTRAPHADHHHIDRRPSIGDASWLHKRGSGWGGMVFIAAGLVLLATTAWMWRGRFTGTGTSVVAATWETFNTARGQRAAVELADGTRVVLAPESQLRVRHAAERETQHSAREVQLNGEAYFDVAHVDGNPFTIRTPDGAVTVLGTAFDVRAYSGDNATRVAVARGQVGLEPSKLDAQRDSMASSGWRTAQPALGVVVLTRGDLGLMTGAGVTSVEHGVDVTQYTSWLTGQLTFTDAPLRNVKAEMERWYDVKIVLGDSAYGSYHVTASLRPGSVDNAVDVLDKLLDLRSERRGDTVWILKKH